MDFVGARSAVLAVLRGVSAGDRSRLLHWMRTTNDFDEFMLSNNDVVLRSIAEDLRNCLPIEAMLNSEHLAIKKILDQREPTVHVDAFLYDDDIIDSLCEKGKMSRNYCVVCGSHKTAPLEFISHSFSLMELKFLYQYALPDLTGKILVDVGSRLGAVLFGVLHSDICTQASLLQNADVVVMNNVFEYFLDRLEQARAWEFISHNMRKKGSLLVTVPSLEESISNLQTDILLSQWVEEMKLDYDVYMEKDIDREALEQIHLYKII
ncbi:uncharacterized protein LOC112103980 isoform X3 [Terrapene carolina triunguis]|uniref:uncharacterized protein LOC112103980 isoform X3 n=1 Tax=Terrapene triunguis TaxID=2587831 RepID=UPI000CEFFC47|nr:uncharacterized protein LOC112103980 isoform X3 [Terrapene carolina triunguis]